MTPMGEMPSFDAIRESISTRRADRLEFENANLREALETERKFSAATKARVAELEARCKRLEEAARAVYIDSIVSDHPWTELETRNMHALRDVLEAKP